ncbi:MAG: 6-phosphogluconolactonase [Thermodesulfovibrionales bacterium]
MEAHLNAEHFVFADLEEMSHMAATIFSCVARTAVATSGRFTVALSGGSTPRRLYVLLGTEYRGQVPWDRVDFFWVDERCVPPDDKESNYGMARGLMLSNLAVPGSHIHMIECGDDPALAALRYEAEVRKCLGQGEVPSFDLVVLGLGQDGHTASLFPGAESLHEKERLALPVYGGDPEGWRVTLTLPVLNNARNVLFLVSGGGKAEIVRSILEDPAARFSYPAGLVSPLQGNCTWLLDAAAAKGLSR